jgi:NADPH:quinone reductase-like Zn-dependent oxidoreductase
MKAAIVSSAGQPPVYGEFADPVAAPGQSVVRVHAASISHVTRGRASGSHYSSGGVLPFVPGIDGVGVTDDGRRVYFLMPESPWGAMAERCPVDLRHQIELPQGLNDESAAAMAIPGMSSWAALSERAHLKAGETVLVNGATGASGRLAIQIARHLGAAKVIATGRHSSSFAELKELGADVTIELVEDRAALEEAFKREFRDGVDIVLDYLWGVSAEVLIVAAAKAGPDGKAMRFVQIGSMSGGNITLPSAALRSSAIELMGSGIGSVPFERLLEAIRGVLTAAPAAGFRIATRMLPLAEISAAWASKDTEARVVLSPG